jgi:hypothetical protein
MKTKSLLILIALVVMISPIFANAQTSSGTLTIGGTVTGSISLVFNSGPLALTAGAGTNTATLNYGSISKYGVAPANVIITPGTGNWTAAADFNVNVTAYNTTSTSYKLNVSGPATYPAGIAGAALKTGATTITIPAGSGIDVWGGTSSVAAKNYGANQTVTAITTINDTANAAAFNYNLSFLATAL